MADYLSKLVDSQRYQQSRVERAELIEDVIGELLERAETIIDLGSGTGLIKDYLSRRIGKPILGVELDREFMLLAKDTCLGTVTELPVGNGTVDLILCNHLYEHVEDRAALFSEMRRVLSPSGRVYFTVGNRFQILEPHYRLPFLSWCPGWLASLYLRALRRGTHYHHIRFPTYKGLLRYLDAHCLEAEDITLDVLRQRGHCIKGPLRKLLLWALLRVPGCVRPALLRWLSPQWFLLLRGRQA